MELEKDESALVLKGNTFEIHLPAGVEEAPVSFQQLILVAVSVLLRDRDEEFYAILEKKIAVLVKEMEEL